MIINRFLSLFLVLSLWLSAAGFTQTPANLLAAGPVVAAPGAFNKVEPADGTTTSSTQVTLKWTASPTAGVTYEYCLATKVQCPPGKYKSVGANTAVTVTLQPGTTYFWHVRATAPDRSVTYADNGQAWRFTTATAAPQGFSKLTPANNATDQGLTVTLTWQASSGLQVNYAICYDTINNSTCDSSWSQPIQATSTTISGLKNETIYYWQVRASNANGTIYANAGTWWAFETLQNPPGPFGKLQPGQNNTNLPLNTKLNWSQSAGTGVTYEYCLDEEATNDNQCDSAWLTANFADLPLAPGGLALGKQYSWQVRASNSSGTVEANSGVWWVFSTIPQVPTDFQKFSPANGADDVPLTPSLYWSTSSGTGITYEYCLELLSQGCQNGDFISVGSNTWVDISTPLARNTDYVWQVRARDASNQLKYADGTLANTWQFTTLPNPPVYNPALGIFSTPEDQVLSASVTATSPAGRPLTFLPFGSSPAGLNFVLGANGDFIYTPTADFNGTVTFQFTISDGVNPPAGPFTASINVTEVNDKPVFAGSFAENKVYAFNYPTDSDVYLYIETADVDLPYGDTLTLVVTNGTPPTDAMFVIRTDPDSHTTSAEFVWPAATWSTVHPEPYSFTLRVTDSKGLYSELVFTVQIDAIKLYLPQINRQ